MILVMIAAGLFVLGLFQWNEKGPLLNNAYLFASEQERRTMDKKPHYRQSGIVFCLSGGVFLLIALETMLETGWLYGAVWAVALVTVVYAMASSIKAMIQKK